MHGERESGRGRCRTPNAPRRFLAPSTAPLAKKQTGIDYSAASLTDPAGFAGVDGIFRFTPDGLSERGLAVVEIGRDEVKVVGDPPRSFGTPGTN